MEFTYVEYEFAGGDAAPAQRLSDLLTAGGYQSLRQDAAQLLRRYLPGGSLSGTADPPGGPPRETGSARTVDVLVPPAEPAARVLLCERPGPDASGGTVVAAVALGRSQSEAQRVCTALRLVLDPKAPAAAAARPREPGNGGPRGRRFPEEWLRALGLGRPITSGAGARPPAATQALLSLQGAPEILGRPALLRSRADRLPASGGAAADAELLDGLAAERLVDRTFVLVCRESGQVVGIGKDAAEIQAAMQLSLRCPHCRRPLSEESPDVVYSLTPQGEELLRSTRWIRDAVESALVRRHCDTVVVADGAARPAVDVAALYHDAVLLVRVRDGEPAEDDLRSFAGTLAAFEQTVPGVAARGVYVAARPPAGGPVALAPSCTVLDIARLDAGLDRLLDTVKREHFGRLTGGTLAIGHADTGPLLRQAD